MGHAAQEVSPSTVVCMFRVFFILGTVGQYLGGFVSQLINIIFGSVLFDCTEQNFGTE